MAGGPSVFRCNRSSLLQGDDATSYGVQFATGVWSLAVQGVEGILNLTAGTRLTVHRYDNNAALPGTEGLTVVVKDWMNHTIRGDIADASKLLMIFFWNQR